MLFRSGVLLGILSGMALIAAGVLFFRVGILPGAVVLMIAFLISPYGIPKLAAWLTGKLGGLNYTMRDFIIS